MRHASQRPAWRCRGCAPADCRERQRRLFEVQARCGRSGQNARKFEPIQAESLQRLERLASLGRGESTANAQPFFV